MQQVIEMIQKNAKEHIRVELTEFKGHDLVGVRVYAETDSGMLATRKGITVRVELLPEIVTALQKAQEIAAREGLIEGVAVKPSGRGGYRPGAGRKKSALPEPDAEPDLADL
jgi:hypothetical protein